MKIGEILKRLHNVKIDENIDERREIAEYLAQKLSINNSLGIYYYIMTKYRKIYDISSYRKLLKFGGISCDNAYVYVSVRNVYYPASYYFPFLVDSYLLPYAYLSKLGFSYSYAVPATGLKYVSMVVRFPSVNRVVVEVVDINHAAINMNLPRLIPSVLGPKRIDDYRVKEIMSRFSSQKLFAGYDFDEARDIINRYYENHDTSLAKDVKAIRDAYIHIFKPYRIEYNLVTKRPTYIFKW